MYIKRGNVKIKRIISDLRDAIVDSKKVVLFIFEAFNMASKMADVLTVLVRSFLLLHSS